jgi:hypothetical protein
MIDEVIQEILSEAKSLKKKASAGQSVGQQSTEQGGGIRPLAKRASRDLINEVQEKLRQVGLTKFAVYLDEADDPDVLLTFASALLDEFKKVASTGATQPFVPADMPSASSVDPITAFALGLNET